MIHQPRRSPRQSRSQAVAPRKSATPSQVTASTIAASHVVSVLPTPIYRLTSYRPSGKLTGVGSKRTRTLLEARKARGLSQTELALKSGVSQTYISDLEIGSQHNPTIAVVRRLEKALRCTLRFPAPAQGQVA